MAETAVQRAYAVLTSEDEGRVCRDIPESACNAQPENFMRHVISLAATKLGDGLIDPKLVLAWLMGALGAPVYLIGFLVPIREAGALLPQLFVSAKIRSLPQRKWVWAGGSLVQGGAVIGIGLAALTLEGAAAGWAIVGLLTVFALARSACSVSYKDVLGKTVSKSTRGTATGTAGSLASAGVLAFGLLLGAGILPKTAEIIAVVLFVAGGLWIAAAGVFTTLKEEPGATEGGGNPFRVAIEQFGLLRTDGQLVRFIVVRALLIATALAPPYLLALAGAAEESGGLGGLGLFLIASSAAAILGGYVWGRASDRSSRKVLIAAGLLAALAFVLAVLLDRTGGEIDKSGWVLPALLFVLQLAYQGVRLARATHLTDMAGRDSRAAYTALSNTIIGVLLLAGAGVGFLASAFGEAAVLALFAAMCVAASVVAIGLEEVQHDEGE
ncbi:MAG: MFS transporter permease [Rhizobiales bacterium NRL2]|jgi:hypothetical protein|nr:MAG: MFS transporter permease [Rhizobiales bacterium NRL2]